MKFPGALYRTSKAEYLAVYNHWPDISVKLPPDLSEGRHVGHVDYSYGVRVKGIDLFLFEKGVPKLIKHISADKGFGVSDANVVGVFDNDRRRITFFPEHSSRVNQAHDVHYTFVEGQETTELVNLVAADVSTYCVGNNSNPAKNPTGTSINMVPKIIPSTNLERVKNTLREKEYILTGGKAEFVKECILNANIDFGGGCITGWIPGSEASFDGKTFRGFFLAPWDECRYPCYAADKHSSFPKNFLDFNEDLLRRELRGECCLDFGSPVQYGKPIPVLRFGKRTETGSIYTREMLNRTLELMTETGTKGVIPTKFLEFNETVADLLRRTRSTLLFSMGFDEEEPGALAHGCGNEFRFEQAIRYREAKVNSNIYLLIRAHQPPGERELDILKRTNYGSKISMQLLPLVTKSKEAAQRLLGVCWDTLKGAKGQAELPGVSDFTCGSYYLDGGKLRAQKLHPDWLNLMRDHKGIRMCHHDPFETYCGSCFQGPMNVCLTEEVKRKPRIRGKDKKRSAIKKKKLLQRDNHPEFNFDQKGNSSSG